MRKSLGRTLILAGAALALVCSAPAARAQQLPPARQIVERYVEAIGGRRVLEQQRFRHIVTEVRSSVAGFDWAIDSKFARPNKFVTRMEIGQIATVL